jgi:hypothetical protein
MSKGWGVILHYQSKFRKKRGRDRHGRQPLSKKTTAIAAGSIAADSINYSFTVEPGNYIVEVVRPKDVLQ